MRVDSFGFKLKKHKRENGVQVLCGGMFYMGCSVVICWWPVILRAGD
jgi:hypothetical protein